MTAVSFAERVEARAVQVRPVAVLLAVLAFPFYVVGFVAAFVWFGVRWLCAAVAVGWADARERRVTDGSG